MDRKVFIALIISIALFAGYGELMRKNMPAKNTQQLEPQEVTTQKTVEIKLTEYEPKIEEAALDQAQFENFIVTYSRLGGYIQNISLAEFPTQKLSYESIGFLPEDSKVMYTVQVEPDRIIFTDPQAQRKEFIFEGYLLTIKLNKTAQQPVLIFSNVFSSNGLEQRYEEFFTRANEKLLRKPVKKAASGTWSTIDFAGFRNNYFAASLIPGKYVIKVEQVRTQANLIVESKQDQYQIFIGPQRQEDLQLFDLQEVINYGFFHGFSVIILKMLKFFYGLTHSWGISIIVLALTIFLILFPFTASSTKTIKAMQAVQPEIEALRKKYADNPQKLNREIMAVYQQHKINYLGGCLPMLFQLPIFISLYQAFLRMIELKGSAFLWIADLSNPDHLIKLPFGQPLDYFNILPVAITVLAVIQQKVTTSAQAESQQKNMGMFFALFMGIIFYNFPSCLVLYWFVQNLLTLIYQSRLHASGA